VAIRGPALMMFQCESLSSSPGHNHMLTCCSPTVNRPTDCIGDHPRHRRHR
jgi:hypothetical protein